MLSGKFPAICSWAVFDGRPRPSNENSVSTFGLLLCGCFVGRSARNQLAFRNAQLIVSAWSSLMTIVADAVGVPLVTLAAFGASGAFSTSRFRRTTLEVERARSEERRVGKECRSRWSPDH